MNPEIELDRANASPLFESAIVPVFSLTLFVSAALLFWVQPLVTKMLLPLLGGGPSVWNTAMVFFQALLLGGYAYALFISRHFSLRNQAIVHTILLLGATLVLPFAISNRVLASLPTQSNPIPWLLATLFVIVGPPFFLLSATAPLLQRWFSQTTHQSASDPYFLYTISNAGSILALLTFPFLLERVFALHTQSAIWATGYVSMVVLILTCAVFLLLTGRKVTHTPVTLDEVVSAKKRVEWVLLAFVPSSLLLGVTTFIATDIASVPLIWIVPLVIYLSTFVLAFARKQIIRPSVASLLFPFLLLSLGILRALNPPISDWVTIALHLLTFFVAALVCHQRLAQSRPSVTRLPEYYLWIALGGVLGSAFNAFLAPQIFSSPYEYPIAIVLACLLRPITSQERATAMWFRIVFPVFIFLMTYNLSWAAPRLGLPGKVEQGVVLLGPLALCFLLSVQRPIVFGLALAAFMLGTITYLNAGDQTVAAERNFFGVWRVMAPPNEQFRRLYHGTTIHSLQMKDESHKCEATAYYHKDGPLGQVFDVYNSKPAMKPVAAIGLGAGTVATYSSLGQQWDFYEIDPAIVRIASDPQLFTFLSDCMRASHRVILGDARLKLREAPQEQYGIMIMDAFSSDSVPAHLLTTEALTLYLQKLAPDGMLAFHISNRYLKLEPLLAGLSHHAGLSAFIRRDSESNVFGKYPSLWVVMARDDASLGAIPNDSRWARLQGDVVWTDDFSNILTVLDY